MSLESSTQEKTHGARMRNKRHCLVADENRKMSSGGRLDAISAGV